MPFLQLKGVCKSFGGKSEQKEVLHQVNLDIEQGELVALVGYSGVGKSTLVSMIAGLVAPDSGTISLNGRPLAGPGFERGMVFQNYSLLPWLTVFGNIELAVQAGFPRMSQQEQRGRVEEHLGLVGLANARDKRPHELSGGMRQRVALARALASDPEILLMDEPFSALDALTRGTLQSEVERIWRVRRKTALLVTNDIDEGLLLADRIIPMTLGPRATLGAAIDVPLERPRDRKELNHSPVFRGLRRQVTESLLEARQRRRAVIGQSSRPAVTFAAEVA